MRIRLAKSSTYWCVSSQIGDEKYFSLLGGNRMARIPEHEIERLKREVSLQRLVEA